MSKNSEHHDTYIIPPNFIEGSTLFGGMFKIRNVIEAGVLAAAVGVPVFSLDLSLTVRIIILCLTALPLALFALMGIAGEPLSSYIIAFFKWLKNRRVVRRSRKRKGRSRNRKKKSSLRRKTSRCYRRSPVLSASSRQRKSIPRNPGRRKHRNRRSRTAEAKRTRPFSTP